MLDRYNAVRAESAISRADHFIPDGGQWAGAEPGVAALGRAIGDWWKTRPGGGLDVPRRAQSGRRSLDVVLPSGTGTTALFLARHVPPGVQVYAVPCNGSGEQLRRRMEYLDARSGGVGVYPSVLLPPADVTCALGKVSSPLLRHWRDAACDGVFLDLVYGPVAWAAMEACDWQPSCKEHAGDEASGEVGGVIDLQSRDLLYINTGGYEGLEYQMQRYLFGGHLNKYEFADELNSIDRYYVGQWSPAEVIDGARRMAAQRSRLVHTRNAGL